MGSATRSRVSGEDGDADKLDLAGLMFADTIGTLMGGLVTAVLIWATATGLKAALKLLSGTALGRAFGATELGKWLAKNMQKPRPESPGGGGDGESPTGDQAEPVQKPEEPKPSPEEPETGPTAPRPLPPALQAIYDGLSDLAKRQFDNRWERIARDPANPTSTEISRMNAYLKSLYDRYGGYSAGLEAEWNRLQSTGQPTGAKAGDLPTLRTDGDNLLKSIQSAQSAQSAQPQVAGYDALLRRVAAQLDGPLARMESGALEANDANVQGVRSNLDAIAAELNASQQPGVTAVSQQKTGNGQTVDVDVIADNGAKWREIKNTRPFSTQSADWVGDASSQGLKAQVEKLIDVAAAPENAVRGKPPAIEIVFTYPGAEGAVGADVAAALRAMSGTKGVTITVIGVEYTGP